MKRLRRAALVLCSIIYLLVATFLLLTRNPGGVILSLFVLGQGAVLYLLSQVLTTLTQLKDLVILAINHEKHTPEPTPFIDVYLDAGELGA